MNQHFPGSFGLVAYRRLVQGNLPHRNMNIP
jgi:hypothetical protein